MNPMQKQLSRWLRGVLCSALLIATSGASPPTTTPAPKENVTIDLGGDITMEFVLIHPGSFLMGSDKDGAANGPVHKVNITKPFYLGKYEVTQEQWLAVMGYNPGTFPGLKNPVQHVYWDECQTFLRKLAGDAVHGPAFKLPTEAQWEYACRAGSTNRFSFGNDETQLGDYAWFSGNSEGKPHPVGQKKPNAWGLYDMYGNVWEWCADWTGKYPDGEVNDPVNPPSGPNFVHRGDSWKSNARNISSAHRGGNRPIWRHHDVGLRVVYQPPGFGE